MSKLKISFIQTKLHWEDVSANLAMLEEMIWDIDQKVDLIVLPEMFNTGFTMNAKKVAEPSNLTTYKWMLQMAQQTSAAIVGSYIIKEAGKHYNRLFCVSPDGKSEYADKRHLFRMGDEHRHFSAGTKRLIINHKNWKILPLICYDLRFPVWSRNRLMPDNSPEYDLLIYVANWPAPRTQVWETLLKARALENESYCLGVNRIGSDGMDVNYDGHSCCYDFKGNALNHVSSEPGVFIVELDYMALQDFRKKFPAYLDGDDFTLGK